MPFSQKDILLGLVVPALASMVVAAVVGLLLRKRDATGTAAAPAVVLGFLLGYWLLKLGPVVPEFDRDWLPYAAIFALLPAAFPQRGRGLLALQLLVLAMTVAGAGWLLVPVWVNLDPSRTVHLIVWSAYTFLLSSGMLLIARAAANPDQSLSEEQLTPHKNRAPRFGQRLWLFLIVATLAASSALLLLADILLFCKSMLVGTAAFAGFAVAYWVFQPPSSLSGIVLVYAVLISAAMLTGKVNSFSSVPTASYLILPLTPLAYGLALPARRSELSWKRTLLVIGVALAVGGLAIGPALEARSGIESEY